MLQIINIVFVGQNADGYKCSLWIHGVGVQDSGGWSCSTKHDPMDTKAPTITQIQLEVSFRFPVL